MTEWVEVPVSYYLGTCAVPRRSPELSDRLVADPDYSIGSTAS